MSCSSRTSKRGRLIRSPSLSRGARGLASAWGPIVRGAFTSRDTPACPVPDCVPADSPIWIVAGLPVPQPLHERRRLAIVQRHAVVDALDGLVECTRG